MRWREHQPVAKPIVNHGTAREPACSRRLANFRARRGDVQPIQKREIGDRPRSEIRRICDREACRINAAGDHDGQYRQPYLRAKSRSRWSCAGQPKDAPVP